MLIFLTNTKKNTNIGTPSYATAVSIRLIFKSEPDVLLLLVVVVVLVHEYDLDDDDSDTDCDCDVVVSSF